MFKVLFLASTAFYGEALSATSFFGAATNLPSTGFNFPNLDLTSGPNCPAIRCSIPTCAGNQLETPKDANGCPMCPKCVGVQTVPNVLSAAKPAIASLDLDDDVVSPWPCPIPMCIPPPCPQSQQEMSYNAQGCPMCRVCKPGATGVFTNVYANAAARTAGINANLDLDLTNVRPCPVPRCIPPPCPQWQQEIAKDERGCPMCPVCKNPVYTVGDVAANLNLANLNLAPTPVTAASLANVANLNLDLTARICPLLFCVQLSCPLALQVKTTGANGCAGCPRCRDLNIPVPKLERIPIPIPFPDPGPLVNVPVPKLDISGQFGGR